MKVWVIKEEPVASLKPPCTDQPSSSFSRGNLSLRRFLSVSFFMGAAMILGWVMTYPVSEDRKPVVTSQRPISGKPVEQPPPPKTLVLLPATAPLVMGNRPPEILSVEFSPPKPSPGDKLEARVEAADPDGDPVLLSYTWLVNGQIVAKGADPKFPGDILHKHDRISVWVIPSDGVASGVETRSHSIIIANQPPMIVSAPSTTVKEGVYTYAVKARDPDGDPLLFRLTEAPSDMTIESGTGLIRWVVSSKPQTVEVGVVASDGDGAEAFQKFRLFLTQPDLLAPDNDHPDGNGRQDQ